MANVIGMEQRSAILGLWRRKWSHRRIARTLGLNRRTVARHVEQFEQEAVGEDLPEPKCTILPPGNDGSKCTIPPAGDGSSKPAIVPAGKSGRQSQCAAYGESIDLALEKGLNGQRIFQDLVCDYGFEGSYDSVKRYLRKKKAANPSRIWRMETLPGEEAQVDFGTGAWIKGTVVPASCSIEWTPDLQGLWLTNHFPVGMFCTSSVHHLDMPSVFTTGTPSTIKYNPAGTATFRVEDDLGVDIDRDGLADVLFEVEAISSTDVPSSSHYYGLHVKTLEAEIMTRPYADDEVISSTPPTEDTWVQGGSYGQTIIESHLVIDWDDGGGEGWTDGPWYGVRNACLPVRLKIEDRYHYGWIRLSLAYFRFNDMTDFWQLDFHVLDCAINANPDESLRAGER